MKSINNLNISELNELKNITFDIIKHYDFNLSTYREINSLDYTNQLKEKNYKELLDKRNKYSKFYQKIITLIETNIKEYSEFDDK